MPRATPFRSGFSMVELIVVMAVVLILAGIILPSVRMVRDVADTAKCGSNLRQIGMFVLTFANENHDRLPGQGHVGTGSQSWCDIVNIALLADEKVKLPRMMDPPGTNLLCPTFNPPPASWRRCYTFNAYGLGGQLDTTVTPMKSDYGLVVDPPGRLGQGFANYQYLALGAAVSRFSDVSNKVLMQDNERASDGCNSGWPNGVLVQGDDPSYPAYCARGGGFAFRHRGGSVMNFLYLDGRTDGQHPSGSLNSSSRYAF